MTTVVISPEGHYVAKTSEVIGTLEIRDPETGVLLFTHTPPAPWHLNAGDSLRPGQLIITDRPQEKP